MMEEIENSIFRKAVPLILECLYSGEPKIQTTISKEINITYAHTVKCIGLLSDNGILKYIHNGRTKEMSLTKKGKKLSELICKIKEILGDEDGKYDKSS